jgi:ubiquinone/menaquinone biosynthesis C-methylase UbiE
MIKSNLKFKLKNNINYIVRNGKKLQFKPWLGDVFSFMYDSIMKNSIFPKKFSADIKKHYKILTEVLENIHGKKVIELAAGSGSAVNFLNNDNIYTGTDISSGLLKRAYKKFISAGFKNPEVYAAPADDLPFVNNSFDICLCILSLNFFENTEKVLREINRVLLPEGRFICSVPVPERKKNNSHIRGKLYTEEQLKEKLVKNGFTFQAIRQENGALLYFSSGKKHG